MGDKQQAVHMSHVMCGCLEAMGAAHMDRDLVDFLLERLVSATTEDEQEDDVSSSSEEADDFDPEMAHTQEMPEEKQKREAKQKKRKLSASSELQALLAADIIKASLKYIESTAAALVNEAVLLKSGFLYDRLSSLIHQLSEHNGTLVSRILLHLIPKLSNEDVSVRYDAVEAAKSAFTAPYFAVNGCTDFPSVFNTFLSRMRDSDPEVRLAVISFAREYLVEGVAHANGQASVFEALKDRIGDRDIKVRTAAIEVVAAVAMSPNHGTDRMDLACGQELKLRALDRVDSVRSAATLALTQIYSAAITSLLSAFEEDEETQLAVRTESSLTSANSGSSGALTREPSSLPTTRQEAKGRLASRIRRFVDFFSTIPSTVIERVDAKDLTFEERSTIDIFITETFLQFCGNSVFQHKEKHARIAAAVKKSTMSSALDTPSKSTKRGAEMKALSEKKAADEEAAEASEKRPDPTSSALHMTLLVASLSESGRTGFLKWLDDKKSIRNDIRNILSATTGNGADAQLREVIEKRYGKMGKIQLNESLREMLLQAVDLNSMEARLGSCITGIVRNTKNQQAKTTITMVVRKLYFKAFTTGVAQALIEQLTSISKKMSTKEGGRSKKSGSDEQTAHIERIYQVLTGGNYPSIETQLTTTIDVLQRSAAIHPKYLVTSLEKLDELLKSSSDKRVTQAAARMSSMVAALTTDKDARDDHLKSLTDVIKTGSDTKVAAEAGAALMAHFSNSEDPAEAQVESDEFITDRLETALGEVDESVAPAFAALTPLVKLFNSQKALPVLRHVTKLINSSLKAVYKTSLTKDSSSAPAAHAHPHTSASVEGIQFCISWLRTLPNLPNASAGGSHSTSSSARKAGLHTPLSRTPATSPFKTPAGKAKAGGAKTPGSAARRKSLEGALSPSRPVFTLSKDQKTVISQFAAALRDVIDYDQHNDLDHAWLRATAITGAMRLFEFRTYDDLFDLHFYLRLSEVVMDDSLPNLVANEIRLTLTQTLSHVPRLPLKYLPFAVIIAGEPLSLNPIIELRRTYTKNKKSVILASKTADSDALIVRLLSSYLPEFSLPWLIFILAHSTYLEDDAPAYRRTWEYLTIFLGAVMLSSNFDFLFQMLDDIRQVNDALDPENHNIHIVAELGLNVIGALRANDPKLQRPDLNGISMDPKRAVLPGSLYQHRLQTDDAGQQFIYVASNLPSYLPEDWRSPFQRTSSVLQGSGSLAGGDARRGQGRKKRVAAKKARARKLDDSESDSSSDGSITSDEDMQFSSDEESFSEKKRGKANGKSGSKPSAKASSLAKSPSKKNDAALPKRTTPSRKAKSMLPADAFDDDTDSSTSESSDSESEVAPAVRPGKRAKPTANAKSKITAASKRVVDDEESSSEDMKAPPAKRSKRTASASTPSKRTSAASPKTKKAVEIETDTDSEDDSPVTSPASRRPQRSVVAKLSSSAKKSARATPRRPELEDHVSSSSEDEEEMAAPAPRAKRSAASPKKTTATETPKANTKKRTVKTAVEPEESSEEETEEPPAKRSTRLASSSPPAKSTPKRTAKKETTPPPSDDDETELSTPARRTRRALAQTTTTPSKGAKQGKTTAAKTTGRKK